MKRRISDAERTCLYLQPRLPCYLTLSFIPKHWSWGNLCTRRVFALEVHRHELIIEYEGKQYSLPMQRIRRIELFTPAPALQQQQPKQLLPHLNAEQNLRLIAALDNKLHYQCQAEDGVQHLRKDTAIVEVSVPDGKGGMERRIIEMPTIDIEDIEEEEEEE